MLYISESMRLILASVNALIPLCPEHLHATYFASALFIYLTGFCVFFFSQMLLHQTQNYHCSTTGCSLSPNTTASWLLVGGCYDYSYHSTITGCYLSTIASWLLYVHLNGDKLFRISSTICLLFLICWVFLCKWRLIVMLKVHFLKSCEYIK